MTRPRKLDIDSIALSPADYNIIYSRYMQDLKANTISEEPNNFINEPEETEDLDFNHN